MRSWDPMRNFPELDGLDAKEAERIRRDVQKRIARQPKILIGMLVVALIAGFAIFDLARPSNIVGSALGGAAVGIVMGIYMVLIIKPRMKEEFRTMGHPRNGAATPAQ
jgi:membrane associated rhomboid family serine protease